jgi:hypothetical protein
MIHIVYFHGSPGEMETHIKPLRKLNPIGYQFGEAPYNQLAKVHGWSDSMACSKQETATTFGADVNGFNIPNLRATFDAIGEMVRAQPALGHSMIILEMYPTQAVQAVSGKSTAYAHRDQRLLL